MNAMAAREDNKESGVNMMAYWMQQRQRPGTYHRERYLLCGGREYWCEGRYCWIGAAGYFLLSASSGAGISKTLERDR